MKKLFSLIVLAPIAIVLIVLSVANRHPVVFNLDPINPDQPFLAVSLPFFVFLFIALLAGLLLGAMSTWLTQGKHRKMAREAKREALKWQREAEEQKQRAKQAAGEITETADAADSADSADSGKSSGNALTISGKAA